MPSDNTPNDHINRCINLYCPKKLSRKKYIEVNYDFRRSDVVRHFSQALHLQACSANMVKNINKINKKNNVAIHPHIKIVEDRLNKKCRRVGNGANIIVLDIEAKRSKEEKTKGRKQYQLSPINDSKLIIILKEFLKSLPTQLFLSIVEVANTGGGGQVFLQPDEKMINTRYETIIYYLKSKFKDNDLLDGSCLDKHHCNRLIGTINHKYRSKNKELVRSYFLDDELKKELNIPEKCIPFDTKKLYKEAKKFIKKEKKGKKSKYSTSALTKKHGPQGKIYNVIPSAVNTSDSDRTQLQDAFAQIKQGAREEDYYKLFGDSFLFLKRKTGFDNLLTLIDKDSEYYDIVQSRDVSVYDKDYQPGEKQDILVCYGREDTYYEPLKKVGLDLNLNAGSIGVISFLESYLISNGTIKAGTTKKNAFKSAVRHMFSGYGLVDFEWNYAHESKRHAYIKQQTNKISKKYPLLTSDEAESVVKNNEPAENIVKNLNQTEIIENEIWCEAEQEEEALKVLGNISPSEYDLRTLEAVEALEAGEVDVYNFHKNIVDYIADYSLQPLDIYRDIHVAVFDKKMTISEFKNALNLELSNRIINILFYIMRNNMPIETKKAIEKAITIRRNKAPNPSYTILKEMLGLDDICFDDDAQNKTLIDLDPLF